MKWVRLLVERKSQVFIAVLIAFTIILTLGAAILMHSRSTRTSAKLQSDAEKAYVLAQSGINIGQNYADNNPGSLTQTYNIGGGTVRVVVDRDADKITSTSSYKDSTQTLTRNLGSPPAEATTWVKSYGTFGADHEGFFAAQTGDGGYILGGLTFLTRKGGFGAGEADVMLTKINATGYVGPADADTWSKAFGGANDERFVEETDKETGTHGIAIAPQGGYVFAASTLSLSKSSDILLVKVSDAGNMEWARGFIGGNTDSPRAVIQTQDGGYLVAAVTNTPFATVEGPNIIQEAMLLIKTDKNGYIGAAAESGSTTWVKLYDNQATPGNDAPWALAEETDKYILVGASTKNNLDGIILQIDKINGKIMNQKRYGTPHPGNEAFQGILVISEGYLITGMSDSEGPAGSGFNTLFAKLDSNLVPVGTAKVYDDALKGQKINLFAKPTKPPSSGYALGVGLTGTPWDYLLIQTDANGDLKPSSCRIYGTNSYNEFLQSLDVATDGGIILAGYANHWADPLWTLGYSYLVIKTNSEGQLECTSHLSFTPDRPPDGLTQTNFDLDTTLGEPLANLTALVDPTKFYAVDVGPSNTTGQKIFQNSASGIVVVDGCGD